MNFSLCANMSGFCSDSHIFCAHDITDCYVSHTIVNAYNCRCYVCMSCALYAAAVQLDNGAQVLSFCFILFLITVPDGSL